MARHSGVTAAWGAMAFLCGQTVISIMLFGRLHQDGGPWPIVLFIFLTVDLFYARCMVGLVERHAAPAWLVFFSTVLLSLTLIVCSNFWLIFGNDISNLPSHIRALHQFFSSPIFPYGFYIVAVFATKLTATWWRK
jgi:hypothetical protein